MRSFCTIAFLLCLSLPAFAQENRLVFIYYYTWYSNPQFDDTWFHWDHNRRNPPEDIASSFYPKVGPYSSRSLKAINRHMKWLSKAKVNVLVYSWWGQDSFTNTAVRRVLNAAVDYGLKVAFLIEPYAGRTTKSIVKDVRYIYSEYGNHPSFLRLARKTKYGTSPREKGVFFIFEPEFLDHELKLMNARLHGGASDSIILLQSTDAAFIDRSEADGIFAYEAVQSIEDIYEGLLRTVEEKESIFVPCVSPGFNRTRATRKSRKLFRSRFSGATYDQWWEKTIAASPEYIAIISFNEWHEGTQIEPAVARTTGRITYQNYDHSYDKTGISAQESYIERTAYWVDIFLNSNVDADEDKTGNLPTDTNCCIDQIP